MDSQALLLRSVLDRMAPRPWPLSGSQILSCQFPLCFAVREQRRQKPSGLGSVLGFLTIRCLHQPLTPSLPPGRWGHRPWPGPPWRGGTSLKLQYCREPCTRPWVTSAVPSAPLATEQGGKIQPSGLKQWLPGEIETPGHLRHSGTGSLVTWRIWRQAEAVDREARG